MATANPSQPDTSPGRDTQEPRTQEGGYPPGNGDWRQAGSGYGNGYGNPGYGNGYSNPGHVYRDNPGMYGNPGHGRQEHPGYSNQGRQEYPGYSNQGQGQWEPRPYYGRAGGYEGHVDVDPELFRHLVRVVRMLDGKRDQDNPDRYERKDSTPRVRHYVIGPR